MILRVSWTALLLVFLGLILTAVFGWAIGVGLEKP